jgi:cytochrome c oxidase assembly factor CtaG
MIAALFFSAAAIAVYAGAGRRVGWPGGRGVAFAAGAAALAAAPLLGDGGLEDHMVEHALISAVAAPLLVLGSPISLALRSAPYAARRRLLALLRGRSVRALLHPVAGWSLFVAVQWAVHSGPGIDAASASPLAHALEHAALFWTAVLFWLPVLGRNPVPRPLRGAERALYLFCAAPAVDLAAAMLIARGEEAAGAVMLAGMLPIALAAVASTWAWLRRDERVAARREAYGAG